MTDCTVGLFMGAYTPCKRLKVPIRYPLENERKIAKWGCLEPNLSFFVLRTVKNDEVIWWLHQKAVSLYTYLINIGYIQI